MIKRLISLCLCCCISLSISVTASTNTKALSFQEKREQIENDAKAFLASLTPDERSVLQDKLNTQEKFEDNPFGIELYKPTYLLPYYYTGHPDYAIYEGITPNDQKLMHSEFKSQISVAVPIYTLSDKTTLKIAYTQLAYWQVYANSQYFRETNYEPQIFLAYNFMHHWLLEIGTIHQSNGRGGDLERSWNRAYANASFSGEHWMVSLKPWVLIFKGGSSNLHNADITHYLGHGRELFAYKYKKQVFSLMLRNNVTSWFKRGSEELTWSFPIKGQLKLYFQAFSGYGQSLIEYNHYTESVGIGISFNDWI